MTTEVITADKLNGNRNRPINNVKHLQRHLTRQRKVKQIELEEEAAKKLEEENAEAE